MTAPKSVVGRADVDHALSAGSGNPEDFVNGFGQLTKAFFTGASRATAI